jgi:hypothetical protein
MAISLKTKALCGVCFVAGMWVSIQVAVFTDYFHRMDCGDMRDYTTHVVQDMGLEICVWRQNSWPFKTISGIKV